ncbi:hypothetical protein [Streptomyces sp. NPDC007369]|uniref:hypothetical protein n=1 Tax=Streptomyces sp. NPDC007369 TaxID=3154589 RepID=UPI0033CF8CA1
MVRLGILSPIGTAEVDYGRAAGGVTTVPLYSAREVALLPLVRPGIDWHAVAATPAGRRSPLAALAPVDPDRDWVYMAEVGRIAGVGRAAVANWRRRHGDFPAPVGGTTTSPEFDRRAVVEWLLAHDKIAVPSEVPAAALAVVGSDGRTRTFRLASPFLNLSADVEGEDRLSGWATDTDADALAELAAGELGVTVRRLAAPGADPVAMMGEVQVIERFRAGSGGLLVKLSWPARVRGAATPTGVVRHVLPHFTAGGACVCQRQECGGIIPVSWCEEHGDDVTPAVEWHPGGGVRCKALTRV